MGKVTLARVQRALERAQAAKVEPITTELLDRLQRKLRTLPRFTQDVFLAHRIDGLSYAEIAEHTGVTTQRIEREMARAIAALMREFTDDRPILSWWHRFQ